MNYQTTARNRSAAVYSNISAVDEDQSEFASPAVV